MKKIVAKIIFILGSVAFAAGLVFLVLNLTRDPNLKLSDADFLVSVGQWQREAEPNVIWNFTEVGKGTLTTNGHINDYSFVWRIDNQTMKIETDWLEKTYDEHKITIDKANKTFTLTNDSSNYTFVPYAESEDTSTINETQNDKLEKL